MTMLRHYADMLISELTDSKLQPFTEVIIHLIYDEYDTLENACFNFCKKDTRSHQFQSFDTNKHCLYLDILPIRAHREHLIVELINELDKDYVQPYAVSNLIKISELIKALTLLAESTEPDVIQLYKHPKGENIITDKNTLCRILRKYRRSLRKGDDMTIKFCSDIDEDFSSYDGEIVDDEDGEFVMYNADNNTLEEINHRVEDYDSNIICYISESLYDTFGEFVGDEITQAFEYDIRIWLKSN